MVVLTAETCWAMNEYWINNKISSIKLVFFFSLRNYKDDARSNKHKIQYMHIWHKEKHNFLSNPTHFYGTPSKHGAVDNKLHCGVRQMCVCWFYKREISGELYSEARVRNTWPRKSTSCVLITDCTLYYVLRAPTLTQAATFLCAVYITKLPPRS